MTRAGALGFVLLSAVPLFAQDRKTLDEAGVQAIEFVQQKLSSNPGHFAERVFLGLAILAEGSDRFAPTLQKCVQSLMQDIRFGGVEENWYYALSLLFLSEAHKKTPSEELKARLQDLVGKLEKNQEGSGGWSHVKGYKYPAPVNAADLAVVTGIVLAALGNARSAGCAVSAGVLDRAVEYCRGRPDGKGGLFYGTGYPNPDSANTRASLAMIGLELAGRKSELTAKFAEGAAARVQEVEQGHAFPPIHFFASALGNYRSGRFAAFKDRWMKPLLAAREKDGSLLLKNHETHDYERSQLKTTGVSTAVAAFIFLLERGRVFRTAEPPKAAPAAPRKNPFSQK